MIDSGYLIDLLLPSKSIGIELWQDPGGSIFGITTGLIKMCRFGISQPRGRRHKRKRHWRDEYSHQNQDSFYDWKRKYSLVTYCLSTCKAALPGNPASRKEDRVDWRDVVVFRMQHHHHSQKQQ